MTNAQSLFWDDEIKDSFNEMKKVLGSLPTILPLCWDEDFYVNLSVGMDSIGAMLMQKDPKTSLMRPIYFTKRVMKESENDYTSVEKMVLALMFAI